MTLSRDNGVMVMEYLSRSLDAAALRQQVIAHNLANLNTPRFKRSAVVFEANLQQAVAKIAAGPATTHPLHLPAGSALPAPRVQVERHTALRVDGNNVDLEREMLDLVRNQLRYQALVRQINDRCDNWRYVINEGRR